MKPERSGQTVRALVGWFDVGVHQGFLPRTPCVPHTHLNAHADLSAVQLRRQQRLILTVARRESTLWKDMKQNRGPPTKVRKPPTPKPYSHNSRRFSIQRGTSSRPSGLLTCKPKQLPTPKPLEPQRSSTKMSSV